MAEGLQMDTVRLTEAMAGLADAGFLLEQGWAAASASVEQMQGQLGRGELGAIFTAGYQPGAEAATRLASGCTPIAGRLAVAGQQCVQDYLAADRRAVDGLGGVGSGLA